MSHATPPIMTPKVPIQVFIFHDHPHLHYISFMAIVFKMGFTSLTHKQDAPLPLFSLYNSWG